MEHFGLCDHVEHEAVWLCGAWYQLLDRVFSNTQSSIASVFLVPRLHLSAMQWFIRFSGTGRYFSCNYLQNAQCSCFSKLFSRLSGLVF